MHTAFRDPDQLTIIVSRHAHRAETSVLMLHEESGLAVTVYDGWCPVPESLLAAIIQRAVDLWVRTGPIAAANYMARAEKVRKERG